MNGATFATIKFDLSYWVRVWHKLAWLAKSDNVTVANTRWTQFINHAIQFKCDGLSKLHKNTYSSIFQTSSKQIFTSNLRYFNSFKLPYKIRLLAFRSHLKKSGTVDVACLQAVTGGFFAENPFRLSTTARPAPPRRVLSKMAGTKSEHRVFSSKKNSNAYR